MNNNPNDTIHTVETQWHYPMLTEAGFTPETKEAKGFVRSYTYNHPDGRTVTCTTGAQSDYWRSSDGNGGYWKALEKYCIQ